MKKQIIPTKEQQNVLDVFWFILQELEGKGYDSGIQPHIIQAYNLLNRIKFTNNRPRWENKE